MERINNELRKKFFPTIKLSSNYALGNESLSFFLFKKISKHPAIKSLPPRKKSKEIKTTKQKKIKPIKHRPRPPPPKKKPVTKQKTQTKKQKQYLNKKQTESVNLSLIT